jgi:hypothetical protein
LAGTALDIGCPPGIQTRYADPELIGRIEENPWFVADISITHLQLKPARKHFDEVLKRLDLAHRGSGRTTLPIFVSKA